MIDKLNEWRAAQANREINGSLTETAARALGFGQGDLEHFAVEPEPYGTRGNLNWNDWGQGKLTMQSFLERVVLVTKRLGPPKRLSPSTWDGQVGALTASWDIAPPVANPLLTMIEVKVCIYYPHGCKMDPRNPGTSGVRGDLHPECVKVIEEFTEKLEDGVI